LYKKNNRQTRVPCREQQSIGIVAHGKTTSLCPLMDKQARKKDE